MNKAVQLTFQLLFAVEWLKFFESKEQIQDLLDNFRKQFRDMSYNSVANKNAHLQVGDVLKSIHSKYYLHPLQKHEMLYGDLNADMSTTDGL